MYLDLAEKLRNAIRQGEYGPGVLIGSEYELARRENMARMTVRRASQLLVNEGLIERRPGKGLFVRGPQTTVRTVQFIAGNLQWESSLQVSRGAQSVARREGVQIQLYDAHGSTVEDLELLRQLPSAQPAGAIVMSLHSAEFNAALIRLRAQNFPIVLVDQRMQDVAIPSVTSDNQAGGFYVGQALLAQGHRRIAFIGDLVATTVRDRLAGLRDAIADAGVPFDRALVADLSDGADRLADWSVTIDRATRRLMAMPDPPTAIAFSCDGVARPAYRTLAALGLRIPQDVSVAGFDDDPLAEWLSPALTTVKQPFFDMGRAAMELLCRQMANPNAPAERLVLPVVFVPRDSLAPASPDGSCKRTTR
jgi:DNA-binding LacI/PurR family transcriptional regulator